VISTSLLMRHGDILHYHLAGASEKGREKCATHFLWGSIVQWAIGNGVRLIHLGGGVMERDSLHLFKRTFSNTINQYVLGKWVINETRYKDLVEKRVEEDGEEIRESGWFPQYRAPSTKLPIQKLEGKKNN
jgi:serine/alanine adding enzyme